MLDTPAHEHVANPADVEPAGSPYAIEGGKPASNKTLTIAGVAAVAVVAVVLAGGISSRLAAKSALADVSTEAAIPSVTVVHPASSKAGDVVLPGRLSAWSEAPVYARTNGYLRRWFVDIGDHVKAGQTLAIIDTPEVDQQLAAAKAALATAEAQRALAETTSNRWDRLVKVKAVSQQEADQRRGDLAARVAEKNEAIANVNRLEALTGFQHIVAPFDGVVTSRNTDIGALIAAGDARATPLFTVADNNLLRLYVSVPQSYAAVFKPGATAHFTVPDRPNKLYTAKLVRTAGAVNAQNGAMLIQLLYDNHGGDLKPGAYAQVVLDTPPPQSAANVGDLRIPASALLFRKEGTAVAVVDNTGHVTIRPVTIARDYGAELAIGSGIGPDDLVVDSPSDAISTGDKVKPNMAKTKPAHA